MSDKVSVPMRLGFFGPWGGFQPPLPSQPQGQAKFGDGAHSPIHLQNLSIHHQVHASLPINSLTVVRMTFVNKEQRVLEGSFEFGLPPSASIVSYALDFEGKLVDGVVVEKEQARIAFESEVRKGVDPGLVEMVQGNIFRTRVYPIMPNQTRTVQIKYMMPLEEIQGSQGDVHTELPVFFSEPLQHLEVELEVFASAEQLRSRAAPIFTDFPAFDASVNEKSLTIAPNAAGTGWSFNHSFFNVQPSEATGAGKKGIQLLIPGVAREDIMLALEKDQTEKDLTYFVLNYRPAAPQNLPVPAVKREVASVFERLPAKRIVALWDCSLSRCADTKVDGQGGLPDRLTEIQVLKRVVQFYLKESKQDVQLTLIPFRQYPDELTVYSFHFDAAEDVTNNLLAEVENKLKNIVYDGATCMDGLRKALLAAADGDGHGDAEKFSKILLFSDGMGTFSQPPDSEENGDEDAKSALFDPFPAPTFVFNASSPSVGFNAALLKHVANASSGGLFNREDLLSVVNMKSGVEEVVSRMEAVSWGFTRYLVRELSEADASSGSVIMRDASADAVLVDWRQSIEDEEEDLPLPPGGVNLLAQAASASSPEACYAPPPKQPVMKPADGLKDIFPFSSTKLHNGRLLVVGKIRGNKPYELRLIFSTAQGTHAKEESFILNPAKAPTPTFPILNRLFATEKLKYYQVFPNLFQKQIKELGLKYSIVSSNTSLLVLETLEQHIKYKICPPVSRPQMRQQYLNGIVSRQDTEKEQVKANLAHLKGLWNGRKDWYERSKRIGEGQRNKVKENADKSSLFGAVSAFGSFGSASFGAAPSGGGPPPPGVALDGLLDLQSSDAPPQPSFSFRSNEMPAPPPPVSAPSPSPAASAPRPSASMRSVQGESLQSEERSVERRSRNVSSSSSAMKRKKGGFGASGGGGGGSDDEGDGAGEGSSGPSIVVKAYDSSQPYMTSIKKARTAKAAYEAYLQERPKWRTSPSFYFDCASYLLNPSQPFTDVAAPNNANEKAAPAADAGAKGSSSVPAAPAPIASSNSSPGFFDRIFRRNRNANPIPGSLAQSASDNYKSAKARFDLSSPNIQYGMRILTNIMELEFNEVQLLRVVAYKLQEYHQYGMAVQLFKQIRNLRPEEPQSWRDLALCYEEMGKVSLAARLLNQVVLKGQKWDHAYAEIELTALHELNVLIGSQAEGKSEKFQTWKRNGFVLPRSVSSESVSISPYMGSFAVPPAESLEKFMPCNLRIVCVWDTNDTDIDLHVHEPNGEEVYYGHRESSNGGMISRDFRNGYGPEEYLCAVAPYGVYKVSAKYFANHQQSLIGATTLMLHILKHWGTEHEEREIVTLRLDTNKDIVPVCEVHFNPPKRKETMETLRADVQALKTENEQLKAELAAAKKKAPPAIHGYPLRGVAHQGVSCDACSMSPIVGNRYKCLLCDNYDTCEDCERSGRVAVPTHSASHPVVRLVDSAPFAQSPLMWNRSGNVHANVSCSGCMKTPITGYRYACQCGFNLCETCELMGKHDTSHPRQKILGPPINVSFA